MNPWSNLIAGRFVAPERGETPLAVVGPHGAYAPNPVDYRIARQLENRFGDKSNVDMGNAMLNDMGVGDYNVGYKPEANFTPQNVGVYNSRPNYVALSSTLNNPDEQKSTLAHELIHAQEHINGRESVSSDHFGTMKGDEELARMLEGQDDVSRGFDPSKEQARDFPWLQSAGQQSSPMLGPWSMARKNRRLPADVWNGIYPGEAL